MTERIPLLSQMVIHRPPGPLFPNLRTLSFDFNTSKKNNPDLLFYLSPSILELTVYIQEDLDVVNLIGLEEHLPHLQVFRIQLSVGWITSHVINLMMPTFYAMDNLTHLDIGTGDPNRAMPVDFESLISLSQHPALRKCNLLLSDTDFDLDNISAQLIHGFPSLESLMIDWYGEDDMYYVISTIIQSITSANFREIQLDLPEHFTSGLVSHLFACIALHNLRSVTIRYPHWEEDENSREEVRLYCHLEPYVIEQLLPLTELETLSFLGISTNWRGSLSSKMANAWPAIRELLFLQPGQSGTCDELNNPSLTYMPIQDLAYFARLCKKLTRIALPYRSMYESDIDIPLRYRLHTNRTAPIYIANDGTFSLNTLATATFLYYLFGKNISTRPTQPNLFTLHSGLTRLYAAVAKAEERGNEEELDLDYKDWIRAEYMEVEIKSDSEIEATVTRPGLWHAIGYRLQGQQR